MVSVGTHLRAIGEKYLTEKVTPQDSMISKAEAYEMFAKILFKAANYADQYERQAIRS